MMSKIIIGDNLEVMRSMDAESIDLVATDPPFNTGRDFGAYIDEWKWVGDRLKEFDALDGGIREVIDVIDRVHSEAMAAFLAFLAIRLIEMHRVLKPTGSVYLHCDTTSSSYIKIMMDAIFGKNNFQNQITWKRSSSKNDAVKKYGKTCDHILFYSKSSKKYFERQFMKPESNDYLERNYSLNDDDGRGYYRTVPLEGHGSGGFYEYKGITPGPWGWNVKKETLVKMDNDNLLLFPKKQGGRLRKKVYLKDYKGIPISDIWSDIGMIQFHSSEYNDYPTQKPVALYERMILSSCPPQGVVLDPFCGSGTTLVASSNLNRGFVGIDINKDAVNLAKSRLSNSQPKLL